MSGGRRDAPSTARAHYEASGYVRREWTWAMRTGQAIVHTPDNSTPVSKGPVREAADPSAARAHRRESR